MWGGRRPEDVGEPRAIHAVTPDPEPEAPPQVVIPWRSVLSLVLVIVGVVLLAVGVGLLLGVGGALASAGLVAIAIGIILGMGGDE
jgi:small-conductance mechanosensitive channel